VSHGQHPGSRPRKPLKTITLSESESRDAVRLLARMLKDDNRLVDALVQHPTNRSTSTGSVDRVELVKRARRAFLERQSRTSYFEPSLFGEPGWDILLVLYVADLVGGRQTVGTLAEGIGLPLSTVTRWATYLEKERFVAREAHPTDRRKSFVRLLEKGREELDGYFASLEDH
jgi:DNA-binding MarR family transcriptional regulator